MKLYRSDEHFPYRRYGERPRYRASRLHKLRRMMRDTAQMHDICAWFYGVLFIVILLALEILR